MAQSSQSCSVNPQQLWSSVQQPGNSINALHVDPKNCFPKKHSNYFVTKPFFVNLFFLFSCYDFLSGNCRCPQAPSGLSCITSKPTTWAAPPLPVSFKPPLRFRFHLSPSHPAQPFSYADRWKPDPLLLATETRGAGRALPAGWCHIPDSNGEVTRSTTPGQAALCISANKVCVCVCVVTCS